MSMPSLPERVQVLEDEFAGLESALDSRTRTLWVEIQKLQAQVKELAEAKTPYQPVDLFMINTARR